MTDEIVFNLTIEQDYAYLHHVRLMNDSLVAATTASSQLASTTSLSNVIVYAADVPLYLKVLASICYIISMILGIGGNVLVLLVILYHQRLRTKTVTSFFIINLAISDLIFAILCIPSTYITAYIIQYWPFPAYVCIFFNYMQTVSVTLTVYTLIWMTYDKYRAFIKPFNSRMSINSCKCFIIVSWILSLIISFPIAYFTKLTYPSVGDTGYANESYVIDSASSTLGLPQCSEQWPEYLSSLSQAFNIVLLLIQYFIPLIILAYYYLRIYIVLMRGSAPGESMEQRDVNIKKSKKKFLKMVFLMVITFMIFWAPLQFLNVYRFYDEQIAYSIYFGDIFFICHILAVSRSFFNPFIYAGTNSTYREGFKYFICCLCFKQLKNNHLRRKNQNELVSLKSDMTK